MSVGLPSRGWAGPRAGTFAPRRRSCLARAFAKGGVARSWDWPLIFVTCGLTVLGTVLVWAATEPSLRQAGLDPHTYLKKAALWAFLGLILMFVTASIDYRRIRRWTPVLYGLSLLLLLAVLAVGQSVNGAKAWIALPGGFQVEPSEFAKLGLILSAAWLLSRRKLPTGRPTIKDVLYTVARRRAADRPGREGARPRRHPGPRVHPGRHDHRVRHPDLLGARRPRGGVRRHLRGRPGCTCSRATS